MPIPFQLQTLLNSTEDSAYCTSSIENDAINSLEELLKDLQCGEPFTEHKKLDYRKRNALVLPSSSSSGEARGAVGTVRGIKFKTANIFL